MIIILSFSSCTFSNLSMRIVLSFFFSLYFHSFILYFFADRFNRPMCLHLNHNLSMTIFIPMSLYSFISFLFLFTFCLFIIYLLYPILQLFHSHFIYILYLFHVLELLVREIETTSPSS